MNSNELASILEIPDSITLSQVYELENIIHEFPYFQAARAAHLRVLYTQGSYRYNKALKVTASHIGNRTILFNFITSKGFKEPKKPLFSQQKPTLEKKFYDQAIPKGFTDYVTSEVFQPVNPSEVKLPPTNQEVIKSIVGDYQPQTQENRQIEERLEMGKPLNFQQGDSLSFEKWLELSRYKPIERTSQEQASEPLATKNAFEENDKRTKKFDLIDKFLETNPKIEAKKDYVSPFTSPTNEQAGQPLMTETLAKVYLEQGKYTEAIQAYQILILKNPEKIRFFADQIATIKKLQQSNL